ncbi:ROK family protein [Pyxidicoccus xibeiensis]|uniref:ROK family protein n=1 Tax=Pyxidicoccus xibeiensis TaxID=2906759 RepID=UPI0020A6DD4F|nr:ROK family protein [Pyxidicoccus xibeiensis]MCP3136646.1 ROK family protein [Pyxidicoccus xibeiensis]
MARRHRVPDVSTLEVWNLPVLGHELWQLLGTPRVDADRRAGVPEPELARRLMPALVEALQLLVPRHVVEAVWLSGGLACIEGFGRLLAEASATLPCPVYVAEDPRFAPVRSGLRLLARSMERRLNEPPPSASHVERTTGKAGLNEPPPSASPVERTPGHAGLNEPALRTAPAARIAGHTGVNKPPAPASPVAIDVGQTSIKCASPSALRVFERDTTTLPLRLIGTPRPADGHHIPAAVRFIAGALRTFVEQDVTVPPDALCLALPCPLDNALVPGGCTYGWEGHTRLVADLLDAAKLPGPGGTVLVLNDAELAAEAAREDARLADSGRVLCLTLGFGPGGALLERG